MNRFFTIILLAICAFLPSCVSTEGSRDLGRIPGYAAPTIAKNMTAALDEYPEANVTTPSGRPIFDAFNAEFTKRGWSIQPSDKKLHTTVKEGDWATRNVRILTKKYNGGIRLIQLVTPYFDVSQTYRLHDRSELVVPTSGVTIREKAYAPNLP